MLFYSFLWGIMAVISFFDLTNLKNKIKKEIVFLCAIVCTFLGGIRDKVGTDWNQYYYFFTDNNTYNDFFYSIYNFEYGYLWLNYLVKIISDQYTIFLLFFTGIICFFKYKTITKLSSLPLVIFLLNFSYYRGDIFSVRQSLAIAIVIFSVIYIYRKEPLKFLLIVFIASFFHRTAIIFLPAYWIYYRDFSIKWLLIVLLGALVIGSSGIIEYFIAHFVGIDVTLLEKMIMYTEEQDNNFGRETVGIMGMVYPALKKIIYSILFLIFMNKLSKKIDYYKGFFNLFFVSNIIYCLFIFSVPEIAVRATIYYNFFEIFLLGSVISISKNIKIRIIIWVLIVMYSYIYYWYGLNRFYELYVPYNSILG